jgi:Transposase DDE domain
VCALVHVTLPQRIDREYRYMLSGFEQRHGITDRARRRRLRWAEEERRLYQRHRWRSEGFHGEAKTWRGLARAVRRGLDNMRIQALLTAAAINLKRLAAALIVLLGWIRPWQSALLMPAVIAP